MKHISIVIPEGEIILSSVIGSYKIFTRVNDFFVTKRKEPPFHVQLAGQNKDTNLYEGLFSIHPEVRLDDVKKTDLIIIPAVHGADMHAVMKQNEKLISWINQQYMQGAEVASLCVGAFLLASTGIMKGKRCATHWMFADIFRKMFPDVDLVDDKIIVDECGIYSSGGAFSFLNLILYLVEKYCGRETAVLCSKVFEIEIDRVNQSPFAIFTGQKDHEDEQVKNAQIFIENNFREKVTVDQLASMFALSRRNFERRFKKATANTPVEYIQRVKVEAAKKSLEAGRENVNEVMYKVGYNDTKAFRVIFKKITGLSPLEYRNRYSRQLTMN
ncbi:MAG: helix-turn-helix domain-containing protein [Bacteroidetes bacterium]|nr:helix-turn-helix domain-containing protein [Bacteroidota bacterium]